MTPASIAEFMVAALEITDYRAALQRLWQQAQNKVKVITHS